MARRVTDGTSRGSSHSTARRRAGVGRAAGRASQPASRRRKVMESGLLGAVAQRRADPPYLLRRMSAADGADVLKGCQSSGYDGPGPADKPLSAARAAELER